jgi:hypothetical protein
MKTLQIIAELQKLEPNPTINYLIAKIRNSKHFLQSFGSEIEESKAYDDLLKILTDKNIYHYKFISHGSRKRCIVIENLTK